MVFSSLPFLFIFLPITVFFYYILPKKARNGWLFFASLLFYGYGEPLFVLLMFFSVLWNYFCGILISKSKGHLKTVFLFISVFADIFALGYFKYTGLILGTLKSIPAFSFIKVPEIALPIGISFYTFQTMSYIIDVYKGNCKVQKNIINFGTYVALFPQLIAGPIVRYIDIEPQLTERKESLSLFTSGIKLFSAGLIKKLLFANQMGQAWESIRLMGASSGVIAHIFGILAFSLQIYFDFSGYSDMARGLGRMFGFEFVKNFNYPYISKSITEFWRRWHISLGTWFKEYIYIPLGGNKKGKLRQTLNIFVVWALTGIWHGASWNFLIWGLYFGVILILEKFFLIKILEKMPSFVSHIYSIVIITFGWLIFECSRVSELTEYIRFSFDFSKGLFCQDSLYLIFANLPIFVIGVVFCTPFPKKTYIKLKSKKYFCVFETAVFTGCIILSCALMVKSTYNPFLYFRF